MSETRLGRLERVDLRTAWVSEPLSFTPWLAREENISLLGDALGIDLEVEAQERSVGPFRADILCKDRDTGDWVLIENQLARTDHTHLGQLLTYATGLETVTIVWIASGFTAEHRATLDWLNEITDERFAFFGLEIELWRIGTSEMAPKFNVVSRPDSWTRSVSDAAKQIEAENLGPKAATQFRWWTDFNNLLSQRKGALRPRKPAVTDFVTWGVGVGSAYLIAWATPKRIACGVVLHAPTAKPWFQSLAKERTEIDALIGHDLEWRELPERKESQVRLELVGASLMDPVDWPRQHQWLLDHLERFHRVFEPKLIRLRNMGPGSPDEVEEAIG